MQRNQDWDISLHNFLESRIAAPFEWGKNDCCLFTADAVLAMTGVDLATEYRDQYTDMVGAFRLVKSITGGTTVEDAVAHAMTEHNVAELPSVAYAQRGDVVVFDGDQGPAVGVVCLDGLNAVFVSDTGLHKVAVLKCRRAWEVR